MLAVDPRPCKKTAKKPFYKALQAPVTSGIADCLRDVPGLGLQGRWRYLKSEAYRSLNPSFRSSSISPKAQAQAMDPHPRHQVLGLLDPSPWPPKRYSQRLKSPKILNPKPHYASFPQAQLGHEVGVLCEFKYMVKGTKEATHIKREGNRALCSGSYCRVNLQSEDSAIPAALFFFKAS